MKTIIDLKEELRAMTEDRDYWYNMHQFAAEESYKEGERLEKQIEHLKKQILELKEENGKLKHQLNTIEFYKQFDDLMASV